MTAEEFERVYAANGGQTVEEFRKLMTVRPCVCDYEACTGWQAMSHARSEEYDRNKAAGKLPENLW